MKRFIFFLLLITQLCFGICAHASPVMLPTPTGPNMYVQDYADVIAPTDKDRILDIGKELQEKTSAQVVVLTVKSLDKQPIEAYAENVLQTWELGSRESHNGVLMVVSTDDKQAYIEVGTALTGVIPERLAHTIQKDNMQPFFNQGNYSKGILQGYAAVAGVIAKEAGVKLAGATYPEEEDSIFNLSSTEKIFIGVGITVLLLIDNFLLGGLFAEMVLGLFLLERRPKNNKPNTTNGDDATNK